MAREDAQLKLRLTEKLKAMVAESAAEKGRSINADIVARLEASFDEDDLSGKVAYLEGMNHALGRTVRAFIDHLTQSKEGRDAIYAAILHDEFASAIPPDEGL